MGKKILGFVIGFFTLIIFYQVIKFIVALITTLVLNMIGIHISENARVYSDVNSAAILIGAFGSAFLTYKIYKLLVYGKKGKIKQRLISSGSVEEASDGANEDVRAEIEQKESFLLNKIKTRDLKDGEQNGIEIASFDCGKKNFIRLSERFKHDKTLLDRVVKDWTDYMDVLGDVVHEMEILNYLSREDGQEHLYAREKLYIRMEEIEKRFKDQLGGDYCDSAELKKLRQKEINKTWEESKKLASSESLGQDSARAKK